MDLAWAIGVGLVMATAISANVPSSDSRHLTPAAYLFAIAFGALMLVRRRHPVGVLVVTSWGTIAYYICQFPPIGLAIPMGAGLYVAAEAGRVRWAAGAACAVVGLSLYFRITQGEALRYLLLYDTLLTLSVMAAAMALGRAQRATRCWQEEASERARQAELLAEQEARERVASERAQIARDLHDSLAHTISVVALQVDVAGESADDLPPATRDALERIREASRRAMTELRSAVGVLRSPEPSVPTPSLDDVDRLAGDLSGRGMQVAVERDGDLAQVPPYVAATAFRIVQESLTNALRHGRPDHAEVTLRARDGVLRIEVVDDGRAGGGTGGSGMGIRGMRERAEVLGGLVRAGVRAEGGWAVEAELPVGPR